MENLPLHVTSFPPLAFRIIRGLSVSYLRLRGHPVLEFLTSSPYLPMVVVLGFYRAKVALASQDSDNLVTQIKVILLLTFSFTAFGWQW